jgi:hypothetical protein
VWVAGATGVQEVDPATGAVGYLAGFASPITSVVAFAGNLVAGGSDGLLVMTPPPFSEGPHVFNEAGIDRIPVNALAVGGDRLWSARNDGSILLFASDLNPRDIVFVFNNATALAFDGGSMWAAGASAVRRFQPISDQVIGVYNLANVQALAFDGVGVWAVTSDGDLRQLDPSNNGGTLVDVTVGAFASPPSIAFDGVGLWVTRPDGNQLLHY